MTTKRNTPSINESGAAATADTATFLHLYRVMQTARQVDVVEQDLLRRGEGFFMVSGAGHEATAALAPHLIADDWLHCHYRDKALMIARGISPAMFFKSFLCRNGSHSAGRQMSAHMSDPENKILSLVGPVGNNALQAAGVAASVKNRPGNPIVLCAMGDGTTQEGEALESIAEAVRWQLPVLFVVQDNAFAISTVTGGKTFYSLPDGSIADQFYGIPIHYVNGWDTVESFEAFGRVVAEMRNNRGPAILVHKVRRLWSHTNADDHRVYRTPEEIAKDNAEADPIQHLARYLLDNGIAQSELDKIDEEVLAEVAAAQEEALDDINPEPCFDAKKPLPVELSSREKEYRGKEGDSARLTMIESIREVLKHRLQADERVHLYGQDIEDPKGDVFGVTKGLSTMAPERVINAPLAEATIVGAGIGRALAGDLPVVFLQFADFFPIAFNQILSEMGSMYWRTNGGWQCPMIVMITCGGYRPGLGPFHAHTNDSIAAHVPGVDVFMPSTAADAAGMLNAAFESGRPTLFFYPKNCLNDRTQTTSASDVAKQIVPVGFARVERTGKDITLVGWGNAMHLLRQTADALATVDIEAEVIDLRSLSPWDEEAVVRSAEKTGRLIAVHEDNHTCGFGAEILATVAEKANRPVAMRRLTRADTFVPCNFGNQLEVLPSYKRTLENAAEMLGLDLKWEKPIDPDAELHIIEALGSSPSDESLTILEWKISEGEAVKAGDLIAEIEADKATFELNSPATGVIEKLLVDEGGTIKVGLPLIHLRKTEGVGRPKPITQESPGTPILARRDDVAPEGAKAPAVLRQVRDTVGMSTVSIRQGSRVIPNSQLLAPFPDATPESVIELTGIAERRWIAEGEDAVSLAKGAVEELLEREGLSIGDIDLLVCSTGTPKFVTPSMGCLLLEQLVGTESDVPTQAYDINAACSGYIFALQNGFDYLQSRPNAKVLVVTAETLSPLLDPNDFNTIIIFGDAASATLLTGTEDSKHAKARLFRPVGGSKGDDGSHLRVHAANSLGHVHMKGRRVFSEAVVKMSAMLDQACRENGIALEDLDLVVPHQANQRIIDAIRRRVSFPEEKVYSNIRMNGNTSSTSIPLCLSELLAQAGPRKLGLCAFGGGFTYGAAVVEDLGEG